jgi:hypothetical protein
LCCLWLTIWLLMQHTKINDWTELNYFHIMSLGICPWDRDKPCPRGSLHCSFRKIHLKLVKCKINIFPKMCALPRAASSVVQRCRVYKAWPIHTFLYLHKLPAVPLIIIGVSFAFIFHTRCVDQWIFMLRIFSASLFTIFLSVDINTSFSKHVSFLDLFIFLLAVITITCCYVCVSDFPPQTSVVTFLLFLTFAILVNAGQRRANLSVGR